MSIVKEFRKIEPGELLNREGLIDYISRACLSGLQVSIKRDSEEYEVLQIGNEFRLSGFQDKSLKGGLEAILPKSQQHSHHIGVSIANGGISSYVFYNPEACMYKVQ